MTISNTADLYCLIIENSDIDKKSLIHLLSSIGVQKIYTASTFNDAIAKLSKNHFDLILCEPSVGDSNDLASFSQDLRKQNKSIFSSLFYMISAKRDYDNFITAADCGIDGYIVKPFTQNTILNKINFSFNTRRISSKAISSFEKANFYESKKEALLILNSPTLFCAHPLALRIFLYSLKALGANNEIIIFFNKYFAKKTSIPAWCKLELANALVAIDKPDEALLILEQLTIDNPIFFNSHETLSNIYSGLGEFQKSFNMMETICSKNPNNISRKTACAYKAIETGNYFKAVEIFTEIKLDLRYSRK